MNKYRTIFVPAVELDIAEDYTEEFSTLAEARAARNTIANYTLRLHELGAMRDYSNMAYIEERDEEGDWFEVEDDE